MAAVKLSAPQDEALDLIAEATRKRRRIWRWVGGLSNSRHKSAEVVAAKHGLVQAVKCRGSHNLTWRMTANGWAYLKARAGSIQ